MKVHSTIRNMRGERVYPQQLAVGERHYMSPLKDGRLIVGIIKKRTVTEEWSEERQTTDEFSEVKIDYVRVITPDEGLLNLFKEADRRQGWT